MQESYVQRRLRERYLSSAKTPVPDQVLARSPFPGFSREQLNWLVETFPHRIYDPKLFTALEPYWQYQGAVHCVDELLRLQDAHERENAPSDPRNPMNDPTAERVR